MKYLLIFCVLSILVACGEEEKEKTVVPEVEETLIEVKDGMFTEYYPGKKKVKFQGQQDAEGERHGIWYFYDEAGMKISMTEFYHGKKNGVSLNAIRTEEFITRENMLKIFRLEFGKRMMKMAC